MTYKTEIKRDVFNCIMAETPVVLERHGKEVTKSMTIVTERSEDGLLTLMKIKNKSEKENGFDKILTKVLLLNSNIRKGTEKLVTEQHANALKHIRNYVKEAKEICHVN